MPFKAKMLWSRFYRVTVTCIVTIISTLTVSINFYFVKYDSSLGCLSTMELIPTWLNPYIGKSSCIIDITKIH